MGKYDDILDSVYPKNSERITKKRFKEFYNEMKLNKIKETMLAEELIDNAINSSCEDAIKIIQNSYNILSVKDKNLKVDGIMSEETIKAINNYKNPLELFVWVNMNQFNYYKEHNASSSFMREWINDKVISQVQDYFKQ